MTTTHETAVAAVEQAIASASVARALAVFDALDANADHLTDSDRYDYSLREWNLMVDVDWPIPNEDIARATIRAAAHLPEHTMVDLIDAHFGEADTAVRLDDGSYLRWMPADETVIISFTSGGRTNVVVLARTVTL